MQGQVEVIIQEIQRMLRKNAAELELLNLTTMKLDLSFKATQARPKKIHLQLGVDHYIGEREYDGR